MITLVDIAGATLVAGILVKLVHFDGYNPKYDA